MMHFMPEMGDNSDSTNHNSQFVESMEAVQSRVFLSSHLFFLVYEYRHWDQRGDGLLPLIERGSWMLLKSRGGLNQPTPSRSPKNTVKNQKNKTKSLLDAIV